jgi:uncharacterized protein YecA (UPF0149 family)
MPKSPPPDDASGYYHVIIPMDSADLSSVDPAVSIRRVSASEAHALSRRFREIGRNQPCPCGSGRKYKRCCMQQTN